MGSLVSTSNINAEALIDKIIKYLKTPNFWISVGIIVVAVILWQLFKRARKNYFKRTGENATTASHVAFDIARFLFFFGIIIALMQLNGINVTAIITGLGIISVIVGLALQDFLKDIIMGAHILTDKFFSVGDVVRYVTPEGKIMEGEVISFNIRTTKIKLVDYNEIMTISNRNISEIAVLSDIFDLDVNIPYAVDPSKVHSVLQKITEEIAGIDGITQTMYKGTNNFNDSSVTYRIRYWTSPKNTRNDIRRAATMMLQNGMIENEIPFAFSRLEVEIVNKKES